ncbi:hypothetical protein ACWEWK_15160 [Streptomyces sp. NPDC003757]
MRFGKPGARVRVRAVRGRAVRVRAVQARAVQARAVQARAVQARAVQARAVQARAMQARAMQARGCPGILRSFSSVPSRVGVTPVVARSPVGHPEALCTHGTESW